MTDDKFIEHMLATSLADFDSRLVKILRDDCIRLHQLAGVHMHGVRSELVDGVWYTYLPPTFMRGICITARQQYRQSLLRELLK